VSGMPVTVVVGGQFGGEGKGKVAHFLAQETKAHIAVRVGGSNSGHTVIDSSGSPIIFRHLPTAALLPDVICVLGAGSYINPDILLQEVFRVGLPPRRLLIDPNAMIVTERELNEEKNSLLRQSIASTLSGTGAAVSRRISREPSMLFAKDEKRLEQFVKPVVPFLRDNLEAGQRIIIEGTQGFGLSILHSKYYPYVTSRDTTAAAFVSEAGLSPLDVNDVVLVLRAFPIRVGGNSGPLPNEIDWDTITKESDSALPLIEYTSVTRTVRRIANFDPTVVREAIVVNQPTRIVMNHIDYIDAECVNLNGLTYKATKFANQVELMIKKQIDYLGFGPASMICRKSYSRKVKTL
jgi:adenylosuccinate synthase